MLVVSDSYQNMQGRAVTTVIAADGRWKEEGC